MTKISCIYQFDIGRVDLNPYLSEFMTTTFLRPETVRWPTRCTERRVYTERSRSEVNLEGEDQAPKS
jgi:hypothetical protein